MTLGKWNPFLKREFRTWVHFGSGPWTAAVAEMGGPITRDLSSGEGTLHSDFRHSKLATASWIPHGLVPETCEHQHESAQPPPQIHHSDCHKDKRTLC